MKKAKIVLTAIAVFAVVGGALAFKAKKGTENFCVLIGTAAAGACTDEFFDSQRAGSISYWTTTSDGNDCTLKTCNQTRIHLQAE
jgi:hypothetical protein